MSLRWQVKSFFLDCIEIELQHLMVTRSREVFSICLHGCFLFQETILFCHAILYRRQVPLDVLPVYLLLKMIQSSCMLSLSSGQCAVSFDKTQTQVSFSFVEFPLHHSADFFLLGLVYVTIINWIISSTEYFQDMVFHQLHLRWVRITS